MQQRVLVCGGRTYHDRARLFAVLDAAHEANPIAVLIHGAAQGADELANDWAHERGVPCDYFCADWKAHGKNAGPIRNRMMIDHGKPDIVVAFPGGRGTADMVRQAKDRGIPIAFVKADEAT